MDVSGEQLRHARRPRDLYCVDAQFVAGDVTVLPLAANGFDVAFSGWVVQMIEDVRSFLREARRRPRVRSATPRLRTVR